jgi:hypothetical protein
MAYFNPLAGREPGHALIDSDLDWGQDFLLLKRELRARQISLLHYGFFGTVNPCGPDMPKLLPLVPRTPVTGWIVLSEQFYHSNVFVSIRRAWVGHAGLIGALRAKFPLCAAAARPDPVAGLSLRSFHGVRTSISRTFSKSGRLYVYTRVIPLLSMVAMIWKSKSEAPVTRYALTRTRTRSTTSGRMGKNLIPEAGRPDMPG